MPQATHHGQMLELASLLDDDCGLGMPSLSSIFDQQDLKMGRPSARGSMRKKIDYMERGLSGQSKPRFCTAGLAKKWKKAPIQLGSLFFFA